MARTLGEERAALQSLLADLLLANPGKVIGSKELKAEFGEDIPINDFLMSLSRFHRQTMRLARREQTMPNGEGSKRIADAPGLVYRTKFGGYVYDPKARVGRNGIRANTYPIYIGPGNIQAPQTPVVADILEPEVVAAPVAPPVEVTPPAENPVEVLADAGDTLVLRLNGAIVTATVNARIPVS